MASRSTWRGAIEILGFPVNVALYSRVKTTRDQGFRYLVKGKPARQVYISNADMERREKAAKPHSLRFATWTQAECRQGVEVSADSFRPIPDNLIAKIKDAERSRLIKPRAFVPVDDVPLELARASYIVGWDDKVAGAETAVNQAWNGLLSSGLAYTSEVTVRAGSRDQILVLFARQDGLHAVALPFAAELADVPEFAFARDAKQGKRLAALIEADDETPIVDFDHAAYPSAARERRQKAIDAVVAGKEVAEPEEVPVPEPDVGDLMSRLEAGVRAKGRKPAKKRESKAKVKA
jgi:non-homologous end joining protein Ku